jgi:hypothetical protein
MDAQTSQLVTYLVANGQRWVADQRAHHRPLGRGLNNEELAALAEYFDANTLQSIVIREVSLISNPGFYAELAAKGIPIPLDFAQMDGITFVDTVVIARQNVNANNSSWHSLLFHEAIHVCQYRRFGLPAFIKQYVEGWAQNGFVYRAIPFEAQAYELQAAYETAAQPFSAEQAVLQSYASKA